MDLSNPLSSSMRPRQADVVKALSATTGALSGRQVHQIGGAGSVEGLRGALLQLADAGVVDVDQRPLPVLHASSFGSAARSDGDASSDVDFLLVPVDATDAGAPMWESAVDDLCVAVERWSGNVAHVQTVTREQLHRMAAAGHPS